VVVGAGAAGLVSAAGAAGVGAKVALIEENLLGGDCLNVGCVPSKTLIHAASLAHSLKNTEHLADSGISINGTVQIDFPKIMERVRRIRSEISPNDSAERFTKLGVEVFLGRGKFVDSKSVVVNGKVLQFNKAVIATGGYPSLIPMPGLKELHHLNTNPGDEPRPYVVTNETFFNMTQQPKKLVVIGPGVIGMEMAQSMQRLGTQVTVLGRSGRVLPKEDEDHASIVQSQLEKDGVEFRLNVTEYVSVELTGNLVDGLPEMSFKIKEKGGDSVTELTADAILVATGRRPNVTGMDLDNAGVEYDVRQGILVNDKLQTTNPKIYSAGDCCSTAFKFTHAADFMARSVIRNALFFGKEKMSNLLIPYATYTEPEIASVGLYGKDCEAKGIKYVTFEKHFSDNDRAICDGDKVGMVRIRVEENSDKILGATIIGKNAGNMISEITLAMQSNVGLGSIATVIHPYPTYAEAIRQTGDLYNKTKLTPTAKSLLRGIIKVQRF
jgi:pyruvate/2-oxoglutarate dehydrogenase complex dihydrolipoamide dehydrogenase (E3) component